MAITQAEKLPAAAPAPAPLDDLEQLALRLRHAHRDVVSAAGNMIVKAMDAGALLLQAQQKVKRGTWMAWLAANCPEISDRTVRLYMQLATGREVIEARMKSELATIANPTFTNALEWLNEAERTSTTTDAKSTDTTSATTTDTKSAAHEKRKKTSRDRFEDAWDKLQLPDQEAFVETKYNELAKLMKEVDRKAKD
jgi:chromosomal replication initiation ATPase DnaA